MPKLDVQAPAWVLRWEWLWLCALAASALAAVPVTLGHIGLSWDALNHHIYLGWTAEHPRFDRDLVAAGFQVYQYPYLYWPVYRLAVSGVSGVTAGIVLTQLNVLVVPALSLIASACVPGREWFHVFMRALAVTLAFSSAVVLSMLDTTSNDLLASIPMVWAIALGLHAANAGDAHERQLRRWTLASGALAGVAIAFKLSNGFMAILLPMLWLWPGEGWRPRITRTAVAGVATVLALLLAYGPWAWQVWQVAGNPIYPLFDDWFAPLRELAGWHRS